MFNWFKRTQEDKSSRRSYMDDYYETRNSNPKDGKLLCMYNINIDEGDPNSEWYLVADSVNRTKHNLLVIIDSLNTTIKNYNEWVAKLDTRVKQLEQEIGELKEAKEDEDIKNVIQEFEKERVEIWKTSRVNSELGFESP